MIKQNPIDPRDAIIRKLQTFIARGQKAKALLHLEKMIEFDGGLFSEFEWAKEERRLGWLVRIDLLREWGRISEALAWVCLECELNPKNISAQALKTKLKRELNLDRESEAITLHHQKKLTLKWDGVAGMRHLKAIFERDVILPFQFPELYKQYKVPLPNGILLYGPPGCGKTFIARALAKELGYNFIEVKPSDLASIYVHGTQEKIGGLFKKAKDEAPTLLFFDEFDAFVPKRGDVGFHYGAEVNEFLVHLNECAQNKILIVGATNILKNVDDAVKRPGRLDKKIFVGTPDLEARIEALKLFMKERPQDNIDWLYLAENCDYYTYAELENVINEAAREALEKRVKISTTLIMKALESNLPTYDKEKIEEIYNSI